MNKKEVQKKVDKKESAAFADLQTILCDFNGTITATPRGTAWDATITTPSGKKEYVELKRRKCRFTKFDDLMFLRIPKAERLKKVQEAQGVKVVVVLLYPNSNCYVSMTLDDIIDENNIQEYKYKVTEMDDDSKKEIQHVYCVNRNKLQRQYYKSTIIDK
jgi:hypothetical protein